MDKILENFKDGIEAGIKSAEKRSIDDGGPAFHQPIRDPYSETMMQDMSLRDWFAGMVQADDRLVKCIRAMDDKALELFAIYPNSERETHITEVEYVDFSQIPSEVGKVTKRLELEAKAIARVRYMQADAMLKERSK